MTNREKYAEQILDIALSGGSVAVDEKGNFYKCSDLECKDCIFSRAEQDDCYCGEKIKKWSEQEYVEPPVDWSKVPVDTKILVRVSEDAVREVNDLSGQSHIVVKNLMILGGSRIGMRVAMELQEEVNIKLIDYNAEKAYRLAELLDKTLIINVDGRNTEAMLEEGLPNMDAFLAVTGRSETNILAALLARRMGVKKVIAEVENLNYINLAESMGIDTIVNKKLITASNIFRFTMSTDVQAIKYLTGSEAEVMEFIAKPNSPATRSRVKDMGLPANVIIGGIVRGDKVEIAVGSTEIKAFDRVVVFLSVFLLLRARQVLC